MKTYAAEIAAKLQGAHRARTTGEDTQMDVVKDEDMGKRSESVWTTQIDQAMSLLEELRGRVVGGHAPGDPQSTAVSAERVVELERQLAEQTERADDLSKRASEFYEKTIELEQLLATAYVLREVPWTDVTAGDMTVSKVAGVWMVETWIGIGAVRLRQGEQTFEKAIDRSKGETVAVLVPYVTPEQAEALVREQLGGAAVA